MFLWDKMENSMKLHHEKQKKKTEDYQKKYGEGRMELERGDLLAMLLSAFGVILPAVILILLFIVGFAYFFLIH